MKSYRLTFFGGTRTVTGSNFLGAGEDVSFLVDCGLFQGSTFAGERNRESFPYDPAAVSTLLATHAHIDHIGRIPKLVRDGFRGTIWSTPPTRELATLMLADAQSRIAEECAAEGLPPLYGSADIHVALAQWQTVPYGTAVAVGGGLSATPLQAGHILGSAMWDIRSAQGTQLVFTGDLGNAPTPLLPDPDPVAGATYLVIESVYGDRTHEGREERRARLASVINQSVAEGGTLIIPLFSLEKTQLILHELNHLLERGEIPRVPVFFDSPLGRAVTDVYRTLPQYLSREAREEFARGDDPFQFPKLTVTVSVNDARRIYEARGSKIIIAGSGMSTGGRILTHEARYLPDPQATILFVGYQAAGSLGRAIQEGVKTITIGRKRLSVRARVETVTGYSSHMDSPNLLQFVEGSAETLQKVFVVMGEPRASFFLAQRIHDYLGVDAVVPGEGERFELLL